MNSADILRVETPPHSAKRVSVTIILMEPAINCQLLMEVCVFLIGSLMHSAGRVQNFN